MPTSIDLVIPAFNVDGIIEHTLKRISEQQLPADCQLQVYVSDDASTDSTASVLAGLKAQFDFLNIVSSTDNGGRGEAINRGVAAGSGSIIVILDADCRYISDDAVQEFVSDIEKGSDAVIGVVELQGDGFWPRYTNSVITDRVGGAGEKGLVAFGTPNMAMRRSVYELIGGYAKAYTKYGFEDKDLLVRLERQTDKVSIRPDIRASHDDDLNLKTVCHKFAESGQHSGPLFHSQYPDEYAKLPYARCDADLGKLRRLLRPASAVLRVLTTSFASLALALPLPFSLQRVSVRVALCAAYFDGSARHARKVS
jgi:glycosyltransferase involved in cell wall biosynthesis